MKISTLVCLLLLQILPVTIAADGDTPTPESSSVESTLTPDLKTKSVPITRVTAAQTSTSTTAKPRRSTEPSTPISSLTDNCTAPVRVSNQFNIPGLTGWDLTSHFDYFNNSASEHEHNLNCQWKIAGQNGLVTLIRIDSLTLEAEPSCKFDALTLDYVDLHSNFSVSQNFCGSVESKVILAASDVNISFKTDSSVNYRGFHLQWAFVNASFAEVIKNHSRSAICTKPQELHTISIAGISAPGERLVSHAEFDLDSDRQGSRRYKNNQNCNWTLERKSQYILLWVRLVHLEYSTAGSMAQLCSYDNLTVRFIDAVTGRPFSSTMCALTQDRTFLANSSIEVTFRTDSSVGSRGFAIEWLHLNESQATELRESWSSFSNTTLSTCTTPETVPNATIPRIGSFTGGRLLSHSEYLTIRSSKYRPNMRCKWTIPVPNNLTLIHFKVVSLDLETSSYLMECRFDNLTVEYMDVLTNRLVSKVACNSLHLSYFTSKSDVTVKFFTDRSVSKRGFHLEWFFIPMQIAYLLPGLDGMQSFNCPELGTERSGSFVIELTQLTTKCLWRWTVNNGEIMKITAIYENDLDLRSQFNDHPSTESCCHSSMKILSLSYRDARNYRVAQCLCKNYRNSFTVTAFPGEVSAAVGSRESLPGWRVRVMYSREDEPVHTNCTEVRSTGKYNAKISDHINMTKKINCDWIVRPLDKNHGVKLKITQLNLLQHHISVSDHSSSNPAGMSVGVTLGGTDCFCTLQLSTNESISMETIKNWSVAIQSNASSSLARLSRPQLDQLGRCCGSVNPLLQNRIIGKDELISLAPVNINLNFPRRPTKDLVYEIDIQHFPIAKPQSKLLCPAQQTVSKKHILLDERNRTRLVSLKQVALSSSRDCTTSLNVASLLNRTIAHGIRVSVNCTRNDGQINVVMDDLSVTSLNCNNESALYTLKNNLPVTIEAVGTDGFTALAELVAVALEVNYFCPRYNPASKQWLANLLLYTTFSLGYGGLHLRYCTISLSPKPGQELIVALQVPFSNDYQEEFCLRIGSLQYKPQLSFIIAGAQGDRVKRSLCEQDSPGGLGLQDEVRIKEGETLTIDLTVASQPSSQADTNSIDRDDYEPVLPAKSIDAHIVVNQVEACQQVSASVEKWRLSKDGTQLLSSVTVAPDNTQTDCKLQLDALTAAQIVNHTKLNGAGLSNPSTDDCWSLVVQLDKFSAVCGLKQLVLTVSHWDSLAGSIDHSQREICGSDSSFSWSTVASLQAAGSGMSLWYSGLRSGFTARFSISACKRISDRSDKLVDSSVSDGTISFWLISCLIALAIADACLMLFIFRSNIRQAARHFGNQPRTSTSSASTDAHANLIYLVDGQEK